MPVQVSELTVSASAGQNNREAAISLPIPQVAHLERFESTERLSEPFVIVADVICEEVEVDFITHLGEAAQITIAQDGSPLRTFSGLICEAEFLEEIEAGYRYRLILRPWLHMLGRNLDSVIFQQKTAVEIIQAVFDKRNCQDADFTKLQKHYPSRDYCVQYRESDFAFVSRLMEQEGIYYFFDHRDGRHVMVLCDDRSSAPGQFLRRPGVCAFNADRGRRPGLALDRDRRERDREQGDVPRLRLHPAADQAGGDPHAHGGDVRRVDRDAGGRAPHL